MARPRSAARHQVVPSLGRLLLVLALGPAVTTTAASATLLTLSDFQLLTSASVPIRCILAYNEQIKACSVNDFINSDKCSKSCIRGLQQVQADVQASCIDVMASENSVLGRALMGDLIGALCPGQQPQQPKQPKQPKQSQQSQRTGEPTTTEAGQGVPAVPGLTTPHPSPHPSSTAAAIPPSLRSPTARSSQTTDNNTSSPRGTAAQTPVASPSPSSIPAPVAATPAQPSAAESPKQSPQLIPPESGGGSPLDLIPEDVVAGGDRTRARSRVAAAAVAAAAAGAVILLR